MPRIGLARYLNAFAALLVTMVGCAGQTGSAPGPTPTAGPRPASPPLMEAARRMAAEGKVFVIEGSSGIVAFYNNPRPFCYMYMVPGEWRGAGPGVYRSKDGRTFVEITFVLARALEGVEGRNLVERARTRLARDDEKVLGHPLTEVELVPFESTRPGTWKWHAAARQGERQIIFPTRIIVDVGSDAVVLITVGRTPDDGLAQRIVGTLRTTSNPECYWPVLEETLKAMGQR
jgi:hypothetical protein